jgi:hypothetical protein
MEIKYLGEKTVFLKGKKESVLVNPDDALDNKNGSRVIIYTSESGGGANLKEDRVFINGPGEYEVGGIEVNGVSSEDGDTVYRLVIDGFKVVVVGGLKQELSEKKIDKIEEADVLIVYPEVDSLTGYKMSKELAKKWGANYLIPISNNSEILNKFLNDADNEGLEAFSSLKIEKMEDLPDGLEVKLLKVDN